MTRSLTSAVFLVLALALTVCGTSGEEAKKDAKARNFEVRMMDAPKFDAKDIEIAVGDSVTWINQDSIKHSVTVNDDSDLKKPEIILDGMKFSKRITFDKAGTFSYHCKFHPTDMKGTVTVK
jgi:plastocyanin